MNAEQNSLSRSQPLGRHAVRPPSRFKSSRASSRTNSLSLSLSLCRQFDGVVSVRTEHRVFLRMPYPFLFECCFSRF